MNTSKNLRWLLLLIVLLVIIGGVLGAYYYSEVGGRSGRDITASSPFTNPPPPPEFVSPPLGVMIENELMSRPWQKGLSEAEIVYEAPTEAGITRFLAIFPPGKFPAKFGPIRSARSYFLDWLYEYKGVYVHVGGSDEAMSRLRTAAIFNADQAAYGDYFKRENVGKTALEHTMFTSGENMERLISYKNWRLPYTPPPTLSSNLPHELVTYPNGESITIQFGFPTYRVDYKYDTARQVYLRSQALQPHIDHATNEQIAPAAVIIQRVSSSETGDFKGHINLTTIGQGDALIFYKGKVVTGTWKKAALESPTQFFDSEGTDIALNARPLWIEVVPTQNTLTYN